MRNIFLLSFKFPSVGVTYYFCDELALSQHDTQRHLLFRGSTHAWVSVDFILSFPIPYNLLRALLRALNYSTLLPSRMGVFNE